MSDVLDELRAIRQQFVQALHAGLSRRDWHATETAANDLRDRIDAILNRVPRSGDA